MDALTPAELRRFVLLGAIIDRVDAGEPQVTPGRLMESPADPDERQLLSVDVRALGDQGFVTVDDRFSGMWTARPTGTGREARADFEARRGDALARARQLRNEYLKWIYMADDSKGDTSPTGFVNSGASFLGDSFSFAEVDKAGAWLKDRGFLKGQAAWQTEGPLRPSPTAKGSDYVEKSIDVHVDARDAAPTTSFVFHGSAQVASHSQHVQMVQTNADTREAGREIAKLLSELVAFLPGDEREELGGAAEALLREVDGEARPARLKALGEGALRVLSAGAGGALGSLVSDRLTEFLRTLSL